MGTPLTMEDALREADAEQAPEFVICGDFMRRDLRCRIGIRRLVLRPVETQNYVDLSVDQ